MVIVGVNVFVLISGWFGIRPTLRGAIKLLFQCVFIITICYTVGVVTGVCKLNLSGIINSLTAYRMWFIPSYLGLYLFAPALNLWIEKMSRRQFRNVLIAFFSFEMVYGFCVPEINPIGFGESSFSFFGLYMLGRYLSGCNIVVYGGG